MTSCTIATADCTFGGGPVIVILHGWPSATCWSIWIRVPDLFWRSLIVSPPRPITRPTKVFEQSTVAVIADCRPPRRGERRRDEADERAAPSEMAHSPQEKAVPRDPQELGSPGRWPMMWPMADVVAKG
eukprot:1512980-Prymnesium_polylepis.1